MALRLDHFPAEDGHIESILVGEGVAKVSFQTWDCRRVVLLFEGVAAVLDRSSVFWDIGEYQVEPLEEGIWRYRFFSVAAEQADPPLLEIQAAGVRFYDCGRANGLNDALFALDAEFIGGQRCPWEDTPG